MPAASRFLPSDRYEDALDRAADLWGIEPEYWDIFGERHVTKPHTKQAILESMGVPVDTSESLDSAAEERLWRSWSSTLPPVIVVSEDAAEVAFHIPAETAGRSVTVEIKRETKGHLDRWTISLSKLATLETMSLRGREFVRKSLPLLFPLELGYHELSIGSAKTLLAVCPLRAYLPPQLEHDGRAAGVAISLYGLRSARNWGAGDFTDLRAVIDWVARDLGASFIALNPLHALHNRSPYNTSPYLPLSIFYRNLLYLDIEKIEDFAKCPAARRMFESPRVQAELAALRASEFVEYERVHRLKLRFLKLCFRQFLRQHDDSDWSGFSNRQDVPLELFATYCALDEILYKRNRNLWTWPDWPAEYQDPDSEATRRFAKEHTRTILFYRYVQWQIDRQLADAQRHAIERGLPIGLYHDLALATDRCGSDLWAYRPFYVTGCRVGAPPDDFSPKGQDWAFPPPNAQRHLEDQYRLFALSILKNSRHGGALRIDHVMRFFRLFWIPDGVETSEGAYVRDNSEDLLRILALESVRGKFVVIGEDLGTVTDEVREALSRFGILSYRLFYFEKDRDGRFRLPDQYPRQAVVSSTTHDLPTLAGFWTGRDIEARRAAGLLGDESAYQAQVAGRVTEKQKMLDLLFSLGLLPDWCARAAAQIPELTGELHNAITGFLASTPSQLFVLNQEDLTKETEQQNLPGTTTEYPNWRRKMRFSVEDLRGAQTVRDFSAMLRNWLERTQRTNAGTH